LLVLLVLEVLLIFLHFLLQVAVVKQSDTGDNQCNYKDKQKQGECAGCTRLELARVAIEHGSTFTFALLADASIFAMRVAFLSLKARCRLDYQVGALNDGS